MRKRRSIDSFDDPDFLVEDSGLQSEPDNEPVVKIFVVALIDPDTGEMLDEIQVPRKVFDELKILH